MNITAERLHALRSELAESARRSLAARADSPGDFEELSQMLGLAVRDSSGRLRRCCPWEAGDGLAVPAPRPTRNHAV